MSRFFEYFRENMHGLGLLAPEELFGNLQLAVGTATTLTTAVDKFGSRVTVREVAIAGTKLERLGVLGACLASYYAGAAVGSLAVAASRTLSGDTALSDVIDTANQYGLNRGWLSCSLNLYPGIYDKKNPSRSMYRFMATAP